jgi:hypothetical protein
MTDIRQPFEVSIGQIVNSLLLDVHTAMPGQVISFDSSTQTASVQPCLKRKFAGQNEPTNFPTVEDVPVVFMGSGDFWVTVDVKADSYVLLIVSERAIDNWIEQGGVSDPAKPRKFDMSDCIAIPGLLPDPAKLSGFDSNAIAIRNRDGDIYVKVDASGVSAEAGGGTMTLDSTTGQLDVSGNFTVDK